MNIPTLVSHDLFAQVPVMFIFLRHKQWSQKTRPLWLIVSLGLSNAHRMHWEAGVL